MLGAENGLLRLLLRAADGCQRERGDEACEMHERGRVWENDLSRTTNKIHNTSAPRASGISIRSISSPGGQIDVDR